MSALPARLAFVDLETTGATCAQDRITEIGVIRVGPEGVSEWSTLVNPGTRISAFIEQLTGISNEMARTAPSFREVAATLREQLAGHLFIAHNARFDYGFIRHEFARLDEIFRAPVLCTVKLSRKLYPQHHKHSLDTLIERHGLSVSARHRALGDAQLIHQFWSLHCTDELGRQRLSSAVDELCGQTQLPAQIEASLADDLPEGRGVYVFYGVDAEGRERAVHIGRAKTLRTRVLGYFSRHKPPPAARAELAARVQRIEFFTVADEGEAILLETRLRRNLHCPPARGQ